MYLPACQRLKGASQEALYLLSLCVCERRLVGVLYVLSVSISGGLGLYSRLVVR